MSARSLFKGLKKPKAPVPRQIDEISKEYSDLVSKLGQAEYQMFVFEQDAAQLKQAIWRCNQEAHARNELNAKNAPPPPEPTQENQEA